MAALPFLDIILPISVHFVLTVLFHSNLYVVVFVGCRLVDTDGYWAVVSNTDRYWAVLSNTDGYWALLSDSEL